MSTAASQSRSAVPSASVARRFRGEWGQPRRLKAMQVMDRSYDSRHAGQ